MVKYLKGDYNYRASMMPEEKKKLVKKHLEIFLSREINPSRDSLQVLFNVFNEFIDRQPTDLSCNDCRRAIRDFWKHQIKIWNI